MEDLNKGETLGVDFNSGRRIGSQIIEKEIAFFYPTDLRFFSKQKADFPTGINLQL